MNEKLYLTPKMGLVPELSIQNYDTIAKQIREMVSNAIDANAKNCRISIILKKNSTDLIVEDDGQGMNKEDLKDHFLALGGNDKFFDKTKIGRIGIGFLAAAPLCEFIDIETRKNKSDVIVARLYAKKLTLKELRTENIDKLPIGEIKEEIKNADSKGYDAHFTKIKLINIKPFVLETFSNKKKLENLKDDLRRILPIEFNPKSKIFKHLSKNLSERLISYSKKLSLNVFLNSKDPLSRRVYGDSDEEIIYAVKEFNEEKVDGMKILGYFVYKKNQENKRSKDVKSWEGLIVRVQNVAVTDSGFLGYKGSEERRKRVCGEIFLMGIDKNEAITIDRDNFKEDDLQYIKVKKFIHENLEKFFKSGLNEDWKIKTALNKNIGSAVKLNETMEKVSKEISKLKEDKETKRSLSSYKRTKLIDTSLISSKYSNLKLKPEKDVKSSKHYKIEWEDIVNQKGEIKVDVDLYSKEAWEFVIEGESYTCYFVNAKENDNPCELIEKKKIFNVNRNNRLIKSLKSDYIILCILIEYCRENTKNKEEFSRKLISFLYGLIG